MSHAEDMAREDISQGTRITEAEYAAYGAQGKVSSLGRQFARAKWMWGVLAFLGVVAFAGYAFRDRMDHYATKEEVDADHAAIERHEAEIKEMNAVLRGVVDTQKRTLDGVDEVKRILMNERRR